MHACSTIYKKFKSPDSKVHKPVLIIILLIPAPCSKEWRCVATSKESTKARLHQFVVFFFYQQTIKINQFCTHTSLNSRTHFPSSQSVSAEEFSISPFLVYHAQEQPKTLFFFLNVIITIDAIELKFIKKT